MVNSDGATITEIYGAAVPQDKGADVVGVELFHLKPIVDRLADHLKRSSKLFMDETTAPVLDPERGVTKTGYLWALARDDRPSGGKDPPGVVYFYAPGRAGQNAETFLTGFDGILQIDGYTGYNRLTKPSRKGSTPIRVAHCWAHLWMPPLLQGFSSLIHTPWLRSSIRPVTTMLPASPGSTVNPRAGSQSRTTTSKLDAPHGLSQHRSARLWHLVQNFLRICGDSPASTNKAVSCFLLHGSSYRGSVEPAKLHHCPDYTRRLVCYSNCGDVCGTSRPQLGKPNRGLTPPSHDGPATMEDKVSQVTVSTLADPVKTIHATCRTLLLEQGQAKLRNGGQT